MSKTLIDIFGFIAAALTTLAFLPQTIKTIKSKRTQDISLFMYCLMVSGIAMWFVYGVYIHSWPIMIANFISFMLTAVILVMKIRYK